MNSHLKPLSRSIRWEELAIILKRKTGQDRFILKDQERKKKKKRPGRRKGSLLVKRKSRAQEKSSSKRIGSK